MQQDENKQLMHCDKIPLRDMEHATFWLEDKMQSLASKVRYILDFDIVA